MSSGQRPRTPAHFPNMKYRARKRHAARDFAAQQFEAAFLSLLRLSPEFAHAFRTGMDEILGHLGIARDNVRTVLGTHPRLQWSVPDDPFDEPTRRPWFESLTEAEARGAHGSGELGFAQCDCADCEKRDDELLQTEPIDAITHDDYEAAAIMAAEADPDYGKDLDDE